MKKILYTVLLLSVTLFAEAQDNDFKKDVKQLIKLMGVPEQVEYTREDEILSVSPENEEIFTKQLDSLLLVYNEKVELHFLEKYTHDEVKEIIRFYETPLGKKLTKENRGYISAYNEAKHMYYELQGEILYFIKTGRYKEKE
ncbi:DUF2059 domain-containing protein [Flavobacterium rakeshii]|uniref:DUF2059 domain-containing protein n=1 Tax=Flavobacterium rakeshii TaxID=1038845 RepID=A0A6N8H7K8_9FLAO|nr:DUF2059 domain-containing protein [Flavobacterium rakeshii]MUV02594.1 DUF2059 domain-containing protein [Flavobacterium rakeshii]